MKGHDSTTRWTWRSCHDEIRDRFGDPRRRRLIERLAERTATIDAIGLETGHASMHFVRRCGYRRFLRQAWPKLTAVFHTATHLIVGIMTSRGPGQDSPQFPEAMRTALSNHLENI